MKSLAVSIIADIHLVWQSHMSRRIQRRYKFRFKTDNRKIVPFPHFHEKLLFPFQLLTVSSEGRWTDKTSPRSKISTFTSFNYQSRRLQHRTPFIKAPLFDSYLVLSFSKGTPLSIENLRKSWINSPFSLTELALRPNPINVTN